MALNPDGAFSIGIKIGRRSMDMLLVDFVGQSRQRLTLAYDFPDPDSLFGEIEARLERLPRAARSAARAATRHRHRGATVARRLARVARHRARRAAKWDRMDIQARVGR